MSTKEPAGNTPVRSIRVAPEVWAEWRRAAAKLGVDTSTLVREAVSAYLAEQPSESPTPQ